MTVDEALHGPRPPWARFRRLLGWVLTAYWLAMFVGTHVPLPDRVVPEDSDKLLHALAYLGLTLLFTLWRSARFHLTVKRYGVVLVILTVYAAADELLQIPVGRYADVADWAADVVGIAMGLAIFHLLRRQLAL